MFSISLLLFFLFLWVCAFHATPPCRCCNISPPGPLLWHLFLSRRCVAVAVCPCQLYARYEQPMHVYPLFLIIITISSNFVCSLIIDTLFPSLHTTSNSFLSTSHFLRCMAVPFIFCETPSKWWYCTSDWLLTFIHIFLKRIIHFIQGTVLRDSQSCLPVGAAQHISVL